MSALVVRYPRGSRPLVLRTERDWSRDVAPVRADAASATFELTGVGTRGLYCKPCLLTASGLVWAHGANVLLRERREVYPCFLQTAGALGPVRQVGAYRLRVYTPPGYGENTLKRYPVLVANDGANLFDDRESFAGEWRVDETLQTLDAMSVIDKLLVVGVHAGARSRDYTAPGYTTYARYLAETLVPALDRGYRTLAAPRERATIGASLGGVAALATAWQHPRVFGNAICLSATFGYADDLPDRVVREPRRDLRIYVDSGWPRDNFERTRRLLDGLLANGYVFGRDVLGFAFPGARHRERDWADRLHLPLQFVFGKARR